MLTVKAIDFECGYCGTRFTLTPDEFAEPRLRDLRCPECKCFARVHLSQVKVEVLRGYTAGTLTDQLTAQKSARPRIGREY